MKVIQVTPGNIPIPPNGWGAVEKIIWEYKKSLDNIGYNTTIDYTDNVTKSDNQIVHVHMSNLANLLHSRNIEYVFSLHDHHTEFYGKDSECYIDNYKAIKNSKLTFVHSKHLIEFFDNLPQIVYLPHGANSNDYKFTERIRNNEPKLVMMGNNGIGGDLTNDRKGFLIGIEAAKELNLPITIICPSSNKAFFGYHIPNYDKLEIIYDLDYKNSIDVLNNYDIFLHPSNLEAGHPNLTITESLSMGIPVVGTSNIDVKGLIRVERDVDSFVNGIIECVKKYDSLVCDMKNYRYLLSWDIIVSKMLQHYKKAFNISEKYQLLHNYNNIKSAFNDKQEKSGINITFNDEKTFLKTSVISDGLYATFKDRRTNTIKYQCSIGKEPGQWAFATPNDSFIDWLVEVKQGVNIIYSESLDLRGKKVLLKQKGQTPLWLSSSAQYSILINRFVDETGCNLTIINNEQLGIDCCYDSNAKSENFYYTLNEFQLIDYFRQKNRYEDKTLLTMQSSALGDTIGFIPYAQKWAKLNNKIVDVSINNPDIFDKESYPNLNLINNKNVDLYKYNDINSFEFIFNKSLQKGYSDQFGLEFDEIQAVIKKSGKDRPIKGKYVCIGVHSTSQCKYWNNKDGWETLCKQLRKEGLVPVSVDLHEVFGINGHWNRLPNSCLKKTGLALDEVIRYIEHCEFFIGVSSGLSWLSYGLDKKVVMISGVTEEDTEFKNNNIRVINESVCNGCFGKSQFYKFNAGDWLWCPINKGTSKQFECSTEITSDMVFKKIKEQLL